MKLEINKSRATRAIAAILGIQQENKQPTVSEIAHELLHSEGANAPLHDKRLLLSALQAIHRDPWPFETCPVACFVGKGGANKSTATTQFAVIAALKGLRVLILDTDRQSSVTTWSTARGPDPRIIVEPCEYKHIERMCQRAKNTVFDFILIDHPQQPGPAWPGLVRAVDQFVLLARPSLFDLRTAQQWIHHLETHNASYLMALTSAPPRREKLDNPAVRDARLSLSSRTDRLWNGQITARQAIISATAIGRGIVEFEPAGPASTEYIVLWHRVLEAMKRSVS